MKIINTTKGHDISLYLKDVDGSENGVLIKPNHFVYSPTDERTKSINLHGIKRNIGISSDEKPDHLDYFVPYTEDQLINIPKKNSLQTLNTDTLNSNKVSNEEVVSEIVAESLKNDEIKFKIDKETKDAFKEYCLKKDYNLSQRLRFLMEEDLKNNI